MKDLLLRDTETLFELFVDLFGKVLINEPLLELGDQDITPAQVQALLFLARHSPNYVGDLADGLGISYPAATKAVDRLVAKDLVTRQENAKDRRQSELTVTESGLALLDRVRTERRGRLDGILAKMSPDDTKAMHRGLRSFVTAAFMGDRDLIATLCQRCGCDCYTECIVNQSHLALLGREVDRV